MNNSCQFYIIFGLKNFNIPQNNNVYIDATNITNIKDLSKTILDNYKEKAKQGNKVGSEIIFIIPDEKYRLKTESLIKELKVNGKVEIYKSEKKEEPNKIQPKPEIEKEINIEKKEPTKILKEDNFINTIKKETNQKNKIEPEGMKQPEKISVYQPETNVYKGTVDSNIYNTFNKPKKTNKAPIIIFIISLIFFITSLVLLFFM